MPLVAATPLLVDPGDRPLAEYTLRKLWPDFWGPRTEHVLRQVLLALTEVRGATLVDARGMLVDETHRRWVLKQVTDSHVLKEKSRHPEWDDGSEESRRTSRVGYGLSST